MMKAILLRTVSSLVQYSMVPVHRSSSSLVPAMILSPCTVIQRKQEGGVGEVIKASGRVVGFSDSHLQTPIVFTDSDHPHGLTVELLVFIDRELLVYCGLESYSIIESVCIQVMEPAEEEKNHQLHFDGFMKFLLIRSFCQRAIYDG
ncbi:hypothetical protein NE237_030731 [Protea cynaroides]|uniref:Uncharacterized protein n=1 Tax=Protea cynaroides TaxID=273540 RepID=A0A9Q0JV51_9MAGN|nr:hypothetical protein NE237_030731 [Protea cynaroides]